MLPDFNKLASNLDESVELMRQIVQELAEIKEILRDERDGKVEEDV